MLMRIFLAACDVIQIVEVRDSANASLGATAKSQ
jgi:hypothetical protein